MAQRGYCKNCRFFAPMSNPSFNTDGECRFSQPTFSPSGALQDGSGSPDPRGYWPEVSAGSWCGKFELDGSTVPTQTRSY
jgi:hypothetical protein